MARLLGWKLAVAVGAVAVTQVMSAQSDTVQGTLTVGSSKIPLTNGMAVGYTAPNGQLISVLLSDRAADRQHREGWQVAIVQHDVKNVQQIRNRIDVVERSQYIRHHLD